MPNKGTTFYLKPMEVTFTITTPVSAMPAMVAATPNTPAIPKPTASTQSTYCMTCLALGTAVSYVHTANSDFFPATLRLVWCWRRLGWWKTKRERSKGERTERKLTWVKS